MTGVRWTGPPAPNPMTGTPRDASMMTGKSAGNEVPTVPPAPAPVARAKTTVSQAASVTSVTGTPACRALCVALRKRLIPTLILAPLFFVSSGGGQLARQERLRFASHRPRSEGRWLLPCFTGVSNRQRIDHATLAGPTLLGDPVEVRCMRGSNSVQAPERAFVIDREPGACRWRRQMQRLELIAAVVRWPGRRLGRVRTTGTLELCPVPDHRPGQLGLRGSQPGAWHRGLEDVEDVLELGGVIGARREADRGEKEHRRARIVEFVLIRRDAL